VKPGDRALWDCVGQKRHGCEAALMAPCVVKRVEGKKVVIEGVSMTGICGWERTVHLKELFEDENVSV